MKKRAIISVFDKTGLESFCRELVALGWEIISTGGTAAALNKAGIPSIPVEEVTQFPECLDGRLKTINPKIEGGILALRNNPDHLRTMQELDIQPIDMVVCNLYPFRKKLIEGTAGHEEMVETIDIGGPTMLRAAAKNYESVIVLTDPDDYESVLQGLKSSEGVAHAMRERFAAKVFQHTAHYDALIAGYFNQRLGTSTPRCLTLPFEMNMELRYGENPHQQAAFYSDVIPVAGTLSQAVQHGGKELSFNNINDTSAALELVREFAEPAVVAVKHANPCGVSVAANVFEAYRNAHDADPVSIFGGIVAINREVDEVLAAELNKIFLEVVIAPAYTAAAKEIFAQKKNLRVLELKGMDTPVSLQPAMQYDLKKVSGGLLWQTRDHHALDLNTLKVVTKVQPTQAQMNDLLFAWKVVKHLKSNAIALAKNGTTTGLGSGQTNRVWAVQNAIRQADKLAEGSVLASDAFFPFRDNIDAAAAAGVAAIMQPGGSVRDQEVIDAANEFGIPMIFTGIRHFKH